MSINSFIRTVVLGGIFVIPFIVLVISPSLFFPFISGKGFTYRILVEILFALWLIIALRDERYRPRVSLILGTVSAFVGVVLLADVLGVAPFKSLWSNFERMEGFVAIFHHFLYFVVASTMLASERLWSWFFHTSIGVALFICFYSVLQLGIDIGSWIRWPSELAINQGGVRVDATFGNAAYLASYLLIHIFILAFYISRERLSRAGDILWSAMLGSGMFLLYYLSRISPEGVDAGIVGKVLSGAALVLLIGSLYTYVKARRTIWYTRYVEPVVYGLFILFTFYILIETATRGAILGLFGGAILTALLIAIFEKNNLFVRRAAIGGLLFLCLVAGVFYAAKDSTFIKNNPSLARIASINKSEAGPRLMIWSIAWEGLKDRPLLGWGQENFNYLFNENYNPKMYTQEQWFDRAHNIIFDWLTAGGIVGLLAYLSMYVALLAYIWKMPEGVFAWLRRLLGRIHNGHDNTMTVTERAMLTGLLSAYFFQNLFVFDNFGTYMLFFSVMAYVHFVHGTPLSAEWQKRLSFEPEFTNRVLVPLVVVVALVALYFVNARPISAGTSLIKALSVQGQAQKAEDVPLVYQASLNYYKEVFDLNTFVSTEAREQLIQSAISVSNNQQLDVTTRQSFITLGRTELEQQLRQTPNDARYALFMGYLLNRTRQGAEALPFLERAAELSPSKQTILFELGGAYLAMGDTTKAYDVLKRAYELETSYGEARILYITAAIYAGKEEEVATLLTELYGSSPANDDRILKAYFDTKNFDKVIPIVEARVEKEPLNFQFRINAAAAYLGVNRRTDAIKALQEAISIEPRFKEQGDRWIGEIRAGRTPME